MLYRDFAAWLVDFKRWICRTSFLDAFVAINDYRGNEEDGNNRKELVTDFSGAQYFRHQSSGDSEEKHDHDDALASVAMYMLIGYVELHYLHPVINS